MADTDTVRVVNSPEGVTVALRAAPGRAVHGTATGNVKNETYEFTFTIRGKEDSGYQPRPSMHARNLTTGQNFAHISVFDHFSAIIMRVLASDVEGAPDEWNRKWRDADVEAARVSYRALKKKIVAAREELDAAQRRYDALEEQQSITLERYPELESEGG